MRLKRTKLHILTDKIPKKANALKCAILSDTIEALTYDDNLFTHKKHVARWAISHKSGYLIMSVRSKEKAKIALKRLSNIMDWSKTPKEIKENYKAYQEIRDAIINIQKELG